MDYLWPEQFAQFCSNASTVLVILVLSTIATPYFILPLAGLFILFRRFSRRFAFVSRDLKRLDGTTRSPIYNSFSETLTGLETVRAWGASGRFAAEHRSRIERNLR